MRKVLPIVLVLALVAGLALIKAKQIGLLIKTGKAAEAAGPPPESVATAVATGETWENVLTAIGSIETQKGVSIASESAGVVAKIRFDSGAVVKTGDVLVELESGVERAQLASALARRSLAAQTLTRNKTLVASGTLPGAQLEGDEAALATATADVSALQAQIARKTVRAPFHGKLGIRQVNLGQYLTPGTPVTVLQGEEARFVDFALPQQHLGELPVGATVRLTAAAVEGTLEGAISAIDPTVDMVTRSIRVRATANDPKGVLRPGMFVNVTVVLPQKKPVVAVPATAIVRAPYGNSVFIVEEKAGGGGKVARQQFVRLGAARGDFVAIEQGLPAGAVVVTAGAFKLRNGSAVAIKQDLAPDPQLAPKPENR